MGEFFWQTKWDRLSVEDRARRSRCFWHIMSTNSPISGVIRFFRKFRAPNIYVFAHNRLKELDNKYDFQLKHRKKFELPQPGKDSLPNAEYQAAVAEMFDFLAELRQLQWDSLKPDARETAKQHALTELNNLRSEIVDLKSLITSSERVTAVWMVGSVLVYSKDVVPLYPILLTPFFLAVFGFVRFREFQRNIFDLDCYLREVELAIRPDAGWVSYFFNTRLMERFFDTRKYFWLFAIIVSFSLPIAGWNGWISPQAVRLDFLAVPSDPVLAWLKSLFDQ